MVLDQIPLIPLFSLAFAWLQNVPVNPTTQRKLDFPMRVMPDCLPYFGHGLWLTLLSNVEDWNKVQLKGFYTPLSHAQSAAIELFNAAQRPTTAPPEGEKKRDGPDSKSSRPSDNVKVQQAPPPSKNKEDSKEKEKNQAPIVTDVVIHGRGYNVEKLQMHENYAWMVSEEAYRLFVKQKPAVF